MTSLNRVVLTGKVVSPPRRQYRPDGSPVIQFPLELNDSEDLTGEDRHRKGSGQRGRNRITVVAVGRLADSNLDLLQSGQPLMVIGKLTLRCWQTPEGKSRNRTEVIASDLRRIEGKSRASGPEK
jgi:single-strand DNA-binding protein